MNIVSDKQGRSDKGGFDDGVVELSNKTHRRRVLQMLLVCVISFGCYFSVLNWQSNTTLAIIELMLVVYSLCLLPFSNNNQHQFKISMLFLLPLYSFILYPLSNHNSSETVFVWLFIIPVLSHLLLGRWYGLLLSIIFMSLGSLLFIGRFHENEAIFNVAAGSNILLTGIAILAFSHVYEVSRTRAHGKLLHLATTDSLTSLANRTRFLDVFERERNHAARNGTELSLLLLDLDHFKHVNDNHGHDVGDEVLKYVSATIKHRLRKTDLACRLGGEEFGILLPGASLDRAISIAETIRKNIADVPYTREDKLIPLSISIGAAEFGFDGEDLESLYAIADGHLYKAKAAGRNRVRSREMMRNRELDLALTEVS